MRLTGACEVASSLLKGQGVAELMGMCLNPSEFIYAVRLTGACEVAISLLKGQGVAELMGMFLHPTE